ncbi:MAG: hypothetical protein Q8899_00830 [Weeping tea tree witches'-broom phytoplasma]|uniref:O-methyltransferase n=1 Tax=Candidatus Phytoplasma melaleucae TaxID=2982630 RepID=UPI00293B10D0|nr:hypothetical protein [Weeping tea tree witches'-broom phytoplasma]
MPIIDDNTCLLLQKIITTNCFTNILEIGTAIGYSALSMSNGINKIQTIEREYLNYQLALHFLKKLPFNIEIIWSEAFFYQPTQNYDLIFIDAAKAQYTKLFDKYYLFLNKNGVIICDNLNFRNLANTENISINAKKIIKKLIFFKNFLKKNTNFITTFTNIGDGLSISWRKQLPIFIKR